MYVESLPFPTPIIFPQTRKTLTRNQKSLNTPLPQIILAGDSAGGNLALTLLAHLLQPHPSLAPLSLSRPLKSSVLLSPWVTFSQTSASMKACAQMDYLSLPGLTKGFEAFLGGADVDVWNTPLAGEAGFWKGLEKKVGDVRVLAGGLEIFSDDIGVFVERLKVSAGLCFTSFWFFVGWPWM